MAHELSFRNSTGKYEMAWAGQTPWHGLGQKLVPGASHEQWRQAAGMDWKILRSKVRFAPRRDSGPEDFQVIDDKHVLFRSDTLAPLGVVSDGYKIVQPEQVLRYFDDLAQTSDFTLETAGTLFGGRHFWALASVGETAHVLDPKDKILGRLLLATSADGSLATTGKFLVESVVCHNTLTRGLAETGGSQVKVRHRTNFSAERINKRLGIQLRKQFGETMKELRKLASTEMSQEDRVKATLELYAPDAGIGALKEADLMKLTKGRAAKRIAYLAASDQAIGADLTGRSGSAWAWLNSVTQFVDHESESRTDAARLRRAWWGNGEALKNKAYDIASRISVEGLPKLAMSMDALIDGLNNGPVDEVDELEEVN